MCMQCVAGAATAIGTASGFRAWVAVRFRDRLGPARMRVLSGGLLLVAVLAAGIGFGGAS